MKCHSKEKLIEWVKDVVACYKSLLIWTDRGVWIQQEDGEMSRRTRRKKDVMCVQRILLIFYASTIIVVCECNKGWKVNEKRQEASKKTVYEEEG